MRRYVTNKEAEKILIYKDPPIETQSKRNVKAKVIPVIIGSTGTISEAYRQYRSHVLGKHEIEELQQTAILGTAHVLRKVLT